MIVLKFGGSSVDTPEKLRTIEEIVQDSQSKPILIVSAIKGTTDDLISLATHAYQQNPEAKSVFYRIQHQHNALISSLRINLNLDDEFNLLYKTTNLRDKPFPQYLDSIQSFGEILSSKIIASYLQSRGIAAHQYNSFDLGLVTDSNFTSAEYLPFCATEIKTHALGIDHIPIITGFIAKDSNGNATTLGRNGSDYSAAIFASAIEAEELQIWTDVNGVLTANPRIVPNARTISHLSYREASELAYFGASVLHPKSLQPVKLSNIPVRVLNTQNRKGPNTLIQDTSDSNGVKAIASKNNISTINIESSRMLGAHGYLASIFEIFSEFKKPVDVITTSEVSVSCTIDNQSNLQDIVDRLTKLGKVEISNPNAVICIVGDGLRYKPDVLARTFNLLRDNNIDVGMVSYGASTSNLTFLVAGNLESKVVRLLHREFIDN